MRDLRSCWVTGTILSILLLGLLGFLLNTVMQNMDMAEPITSSDRLFQSSFQRVTMIAFRIIAVQTMLAGLLGSSLSWAALRWSQPLKQAR
jgi:purine-cytosine permease-like protein